MHEDGFQSVFVMVHETGHNLGMEHDGEGQNMCGDFTHQGSIMSPLVQSNFKTFTWSHCSQNYLRKYMREFRCINTNPGTSYRSCDSGKQRIMQAKRMPSGFMSNGNCLYSLESRLGVASDPYD